MQIKFGDYLFIIERSDVGFILRIATLDNVRIIDLKISSKTLNSLCFIIEYVTMGAESNFIKVPMANSTYQHVIYVYRNYSNFENIYISIYKQSLINNKDIPIIKTHSHADSGEIDNLFYALKQVQNI